jgi:predicted nucleic acid-binding Zn ribbon protein
MLQAKQEIKNCLTCGKPVKGRSDKKFCDDYCRNNYNNQLKANDSEIIRLINNILSKNRRILQSFLPPDKDTAKTTRDQLLLKGFSFTYFTHIYTTKTGNTYYYCYDYAWRQLENDWYMIVRKKEE